MYAASQEGKKVKINYANFCSTTRWSVLLGITGIKILGMQCVKCNTKEPRRQTQRINDKSAEKKSCTNKYSNVNSMVCSENIYKIDYCSIGNGSRYERKCHTNTVNA